VNAASVSKGLGYLVSTLSVILLGIVAWKSASEQPLLFACLILGMIASVTGMALRWISHRIEQKEKERLEAKAETSA
jgi:multisubunit Na+/H+ antiporter MnhG subunit